MSIVSLTKACSFSADEKQKYKRTVYSVVSSAMSELGELAEEITISENQSYKTSSDDGVVGEAIDAIICLLDLIHVHNPDITEEQIEIIATRKLTKWISCISN